MTDYDVREGVKNELAWSPKVDAERIAVSVSDGAVTLTGQVGSYLEKWEAERIAKRVYGVTGVANDLSLTITARARRTRICCSGRCRRWSGISRSPRVRCSRPSATAGSRSAAT